MSSDNLFLRLAPPSSSSSPLLLISSSIITTLPFRRFPSNTQLILTQQISVDYEPANTFKSVDAVWYRNQTFLLGFQAGDATGYRECCSSKWCTRRRANASHHGFQWLPPIWNGWCTAKECYSRDHSSTQGIHSKYRHFSSPYLNYRILASPHSQQVSSRLFLSPRASLSLPRLVGALAFRVRDTFSHDWLLA